MANKYQTQAQGMMNGYYQSQQSQLQNSLNTNINNLDTSKQGINSNYDNQVAVNNRNTQKNVNNFANNSISRGLGNSSIMATGNAEISNIGSRIGNEIEQMRTGDLNNIEMQKALLQSNYENDLIGMKGRQDYEIGQLAMKLEQDALAEAFRQQQLAMEREKMQAEAGWRNQQIAVQREQMAMEQAYKNQQLAFQKEQASKGDERLEWEKSQYRDWQNAQAEQKKIDKYNNSKATMGSYFTEKDLKNADSVKAKKDFLQSNMNTNSTNYQYDLYALNELEKQYYNQLGSMPSAKNSGSGSSWFDSYRNKTKPNNIFSMRSFW